MISRFFKRDNSVPSSAIGIKTFLEKNEYKGRIARALVSKRASYNQDVKPSTVIKRLERLGVHTFTAGAILGRLEEMSEGMPYTENGTNYVLRVTSQGFRKRRVYQIYKIRRPLIL